MKSSICAFVFAAAMLISFTAKSDYNASTTTPNTSIEKIVAEPLPVSGTNAFGTFTGTFDIQNFVSRNRQLVAIGSLTGTFTDVLGNVTQISSQTVSMPVSNISASCQILHLELGPLDLDLLGLVIHLDQVVLDITAVPGAGNLLGNLLCAITNLLNGGGSFTSIAQLLNLIFAILG